MQARNGAFGLAALAAMALLVVVMHSQALHSTSLVQKGSLADQVDDAVMDKVKSDQLAMDRQTVKDAAAVNERFGGSFSNGVGSNTWAGTPFGKYDDKDVRTEELSQVQKKAGMKHVARHVAHAKHMLHAAKRGKPSWLGEFNSMTFQPEQPRRDVVGEAPTAEKVVFWEGIGDHKDQALKAPSSGRSTRPISMAKKAPTTMLLEKTSYDINARPYYTADSMGTADSEWSQYGHQLKQYNGGNPYAEGWSKLKPAKSLPELYGQISQQLEPLAEEYPYIRAIRH